MSLVRIILGGLGILLALAFASLLLPSIIGIMVGVFMIQDGNIIGGIIAIVIGIGINLVMIFGSGLEAGSSHSFIDDECPYCGSGDTDGNHCYDCDEDF